MSTVSSCRTVLIEKNSINSLTLNENPHLKHQRMLVAGMVAVNASGSEAILPENDIELAFDVKFDVRDIIEINTVRVAINHLLCSGPSNTLHLNPDRISRLQEDCRDGLTRVKASPMDAFREHQDDKALRPTDDDQPHSELDRTVGFKVTRPGLLLLPLGPGDLRLDPGQRVSTLMHCFQEV
ncbi:hypothetical protein GOODEAATRI_008683 [Goodea atripinnis]|uniref:Uncharacterized protein n=1 Tax=Goodea atripinnis TaxID=208336 RepID=A0ABV0PWQ4_9TELE